MIVPNEPSKTTSRVGMVIAIAVMIVIAALVINAMLAYPANYWAPGSNTEVTGAPDGTYQQKDWGSFDAGAWTWSFAMCGHDYLGPLHGTWKVKEGIWIPKTGADWKEGIYPVDAKLWLTVENNTIVHCEITSDSEYGANSGGWDCCPGPLNLALVLPYVFIGAIICSIVAGLICHFKNKSSPVTIEKTDDGKV